MLTPFLFLIIFFPAYSYRIPFPRLLLGNRVGFYHFAKFAETSRADSLSVGIDLGTTYSSISVFENGKTEVIPIDGDVTMPSIVSIFSNGTILVGKEARDAKLRYPQNTFSSVKRLIGRSLDDIHKNGDDVVYLNVNQLNSSALCKLSLENGESINPEMISALVIKKLLREVGKLKLKLPIKAIVTVPAYFEDAQLDATKRAAEMAGLQKVQLLREPEAAAYSYGFLCHHPELVLVVDFGGGTYDVSIVEVSDRFVEIVATSGDNHLGGDDIDDIVSKWIIQKLKQWVRNLSFDKHDVKKKSDNSSSMMAVDTNLFPSIDGSQELFWWTLFESISTENCEKGALKTRDLLPLPQSGAKGSDTKHRDSLLSLIDRCLKNRHFQAHLKTIAEKLKIDLSWKGEIIFSLRDLFEPWLLSSNWSGLACDSSQIPLSCQELLWPKIKFTRKALEGLLKSLLDRMMIPLREVSLMAGVSLLDDDNLDLEDLDRMASNREKDDDDDDEEDDDDYNLENNAKKFSNTISQKGVLDRILLVGGSSYLPCLRQQLEQLTGLFFPSPRSALSFSRHEILSGLSKWKTNLDNKIVNEGKEKKKSSSTVKIEKQRSMQLNKRDMLMIVSPSDERNDGSKKSQNDTIPSTMAIYDACHEDDIHSRAVNSTAMTKKLQRQYWMQIMKEITPEEVVSRGAALQAARCDGDLEEFHVLDPWQAELLRVSLELSKTQNDLKAE